MPSTNQQRRVLVAGGGVAGLEAALALRALAPDRVTVAVMAPEEQFVYRPLSTAEPFRLAEVTRHPLRQLADDQGFELIGDALAEVDTQARVAVGASGTRHEYDDLVVAVGVERRPAFGEPVITFRDERDVAAYRDVLDGLRDGSVRRVAFLLPGGDAWPFPLYELALLTGTFIAEHDLDAELSLVTPVSAPLSMFGRQAAEAIRRMFDERGIAVYSGHDPRPRDGEHLHLAPNGPTLTVDRMVAAPALRGRRVAGLPAGPHGFLPIDPHCAVTGVEGVYAAGDVTAFPVKQGGIAARQADAAAHAIAHAAGADVTPTTFRPVLQGKLLTGAGPTYLRGDLGDGTGASIVSDEALWWPPSKVAGRYLAPVLGTVDATAHEALRAARADAIDVEVEMPLSSED